MRKHIFNEDNVVGNLAFLPINHINCIKAGSSQITQSFLYSFSYQYGLIEEVTLLKMWLYLLHHFQFFFAFNFNFRF